MGTEGDSGILTVSELTAGIKTLLEEAFPLVSVSGEISNYKRHSSGHAYFSLKDDRSQLRCVMWRSANRKLTFEPEDGMEVLARGVLSVYEVQGQYQLVARELKPVGAGALQAAFERLKALLEKEGLFREEHKQPLPSFPERVGVVTSGSGAAIRDIIQVLRRRAPWVSIILRPTPVQGEGAAAEIAAAIGEMNAYGEVDVLIVGRGGGSVEDLWAFNEEAVVRAVFASRIPVVSAVGHETDFTLTDFAADHRAPTPSGAAEIVVRDLRELKDRSDAVLRRLCGSMTGYVDRYRQRVATAVSSYGLRRPVDQVAQYAQYTDELTRRLAERCFHGHETRVQRVGGLAGRLQALSPLSVLERGYAVCQRASDGRVVRGADELSVDDRVNVRLRKGEAFCRVEHLRDAAGPSATASRGKRRKEETAGTATFGLFDESNTQEPA